MAIEAAAENDQIIDLEGIAQWAYTTEPLATLTRYIQEKKNDMMEQQERSIMLARFLDYGIPLALLALTAALLWAIQDDPCNQYTEGTDLFWECVYQEPMDLTPREGN